MKPILNRDTRTYLCLVEIAYHRNGIGGEGFHVVTFTERDGTIKRNMVATVFPNDESKWPENGRVAVLDRDLLAAGTITFAVNSWRGDLYERWLRQQIDALYPSDDV